MPFTFGSLMDARRHLASRVLVDGISVSSAAREAGVSRTTARLWVARAREAGLDRMSAPSRRPHRSPGATGAALVEEILALRSLHPSWGARKLMCLLWPDGEAPLCERTVDRILKRAGSTRNPPPPPVEVGRFEREFPNELWQMDFKGLGENPPPYRVLSVLDDATRFALSLSRIPRGTGPLVWERLWEVFYEYGVPKEVLFDNEHCFHSRQSKGPSFLEARLWRLGVDTTSGRPRHPQTQGKVERFHRTLQETVGRDLRDPGRVDEALRAFREEYDWVRPHEALGMKTPGTRYRRSSRLRPDALPESVPPEGAPVRKVDANGRFKWEGDLYQVGRGLTGEWVALVEEEGELRARYAGKNFARLRDLAP